VFEQRAAGESRLPPISDVAEGGVSGVGRGRFLKNLIYKHQAFNSLIFSWKDACSNAVLGVV
jgi:hypothetical protein